MERNVCVVIRLSKQKKRLQNDMHGDGNSMTWGHYTAASAKVRWNYEEADIPQLEIKTCVTLKPQLGNPQQTLKLFLELRKNLQRR